MAYSLCVRAERVHRLSPINIIAAEGDFVIIHGQYSDFGLPVNWIVVDIVRMQDGVLVGHWDVIQDEATEEQPKSGNPMFGDTFPLRPEPLPEKLSE